MSRSIDDLKTADGRIDARAVRSPDGISEHGIPFPASACRDVRERVANGQTVRDVKQDAYPDRNYTTVRNHVAGDCSHAHDMPALEYVGHAPTGEWQEVDE